MFTIGGVHTFGVFTSRGFTVYSLKYMVCRYMYQKINKLILTYNYVDKESNIYTGIFITYNGSNKKTVQNRICVI